jgi:hypothetical protein
MQVKSGSSKGHPALVLQRCEQQRLLPSCQPCVPCRSIPYNPMLNMPPSVQRCLSDLTFNNNFLLQPVAQGRAKVRGVKWQSCRAGPLLLRGASGRRRPSSDDTLRKRSKLEVSAGCTLQQTQ